MLPLVCAAPIASSSWFKPRTVDDLVPQDHPVRMIWALVQRWDLTGFLQRNPGARRATRTRRH